MVGMYIFRLWCSWVSRVFFHKIFGWGGLAFWDDFLVFIRGGISWGYLCWGCSQMRGDLEKLSAETINAPLQQITANFGVLRWGKIFEILGNKTQLGDRLWWKGGTGGGWGCGQIFCCLGGPQFSPGKKNPEWGVLSSNGFTHWVVPHEIHPPPIPLLSRFPLFCFGFSSYLHQGWRLLVRFVEGEMMEPKLLKKWLKKNLRGANFPKSGGCISSICCEISTHDLHKSSLVI